MLGIEDYARSEAARNRIHVPDDTEKTITTMLVLLEPQDWEMLQAVEPGLHEAAQNEIKGHSGPLKSRLSYI
ncbi:MAG: hypothetical protein WD603_01255 [Patescibacteria group bacterium]